MRLQRRENVVLRSLHSSGGCYHRWRDDNGRIYSSIFARVRHRRSLGGASAPSLPLHLFGKLLDGVESVIGDLSQGL